MNSFGITDRGKVRRDNQDSFLIERIDDRGCLVAVLCDGMGGEQAGNVASHVAAKTFVSAVVEKLS
jgi:protein phosphatase